MLMLIMSCSEKVHSPDVLFMLLGSAEGFTQAEKVINSSSKSGRWVMLKNVHLAPTWLVQLEKKLHNLTPHPSFRLFLTMEINPKVSTLMIISFWRYRS